MLVNQTWQSITNQVPPRATNNISDKKNFQNNSKAKAGSKEKNGVMEKPPPHPSILLCISYFA